VNEVIGWLKDIGLGQYQPSFQRLRINGRQLVSLGADELGKSGLGLTNEHQVRPNLFTRNSKMINIFSWSSLASPCPLGVVTPSSATFDVIFPL